MTTPYGVRPPLEPERAASYYSDDLVTIRHEDAGEAMAAMADESVDIVVTSPPYNMGLVPGGNGRGMYRPGANGKAGRFREGYGDHGDAMPQDEYDAWQRDCLAEMWRVARLGVFYNHRPRVEHGRLRTPLSWDFGPAVLRQIIVWDRGTGIDVNLRAFCTRGEWIMVFAKPAFALVDHAASGMGDVWRLGMATDETEHPGALRMTPLDPDPLTPPEPEWDLHGIEPATSGGVVVWVGLALLLAGVLVLWWVTR